VDDPEMLPPLVPEDEEVPATPPELDPLEFTPDEPEVPLPLVVLFVELPWK
jgi:hypothetical protein